MAGHRRISTDLFLRFANDPAQAWKVAALLSLDHDNWKGGILSIHAYARLWGKSRNAVRALISLWEAHKGDVENASSRDQEGTSEGPSLDPPMDHLTPEESGTCDGVKDHPSDQEGTSEGPARDPFLDPEPEPEGEKRPPRRPSALRVGRAEARERSAERQVLRALERAGPAAPDLQKIRRRRLFELARMYLACAQEPNATQLLDLARRTDEIPLEHLPDAIDLARERRERDGNDWPPTALEISKAAETVAAKARMKARGTA